MRIHEKLLLLALLTVFIPHPGAANPAPPSAPIKLEPQGVLWNQLLFKIESFSADVTAQVLLESMPAATAEAALINSSQGDPIQVAQPEVKRITINYDVDSALRPPVRTINQVWFNPEDAEALGRLRLRRGNDDFKNVYRFTRQGVFRHHLEPKDKQEAGEQPEQWSDVKDTYYGYDLEQLGCHNVTERLVLIYIASAGALSNSSKPLSVCAFGRRQLFEVQLVPQGMHSLGVDYIEKRQQSEVHRQKQVKALKIAIQPRPLASDLDDVEDFSFLSFQEDIAIFIDSESGLPVQISGKIPMAGQTTITLHEAWLK